MAERHSLFDTITDSIAPIHNDGYKFLAIGAGVSLLLFLLWPPLAWLAVLVTAWIAYFFRDPARVTPLREGLVIAPGDGRICAIERVRPPAELGPRRGAARCASRSSSRSSTCTSIARRWPAASSGRSTCRAASSTPPPTRPARRTSGAASSSTRRRRQRDRGGADRRPDRAAHRHLRERGRQRRRRPARRPDPLRLARRSLPAARTRRPGRGRPARDRRRDRARRPQVDRSRSARPARSSRAA